MADFWQRLAARSLGKTPTVQPAIAPLYAPGSLVVQPLDLTEESQDIAPLDSSPAAIPASQQVKLPPTSPFAELTRLSWSDSPRSLQPPETQLLDDRLVENSPQPEPEIQRERPAQQVVAPPVPPIAPQPIALSQTSLPTRSPTNLVSQANTDQTPNLVPSVQPIDRLSVKREQPPDDCPSESRSEKLSTFSENQQNSQPQPIEPTIAQSVLSIAPLIQVAQPQANQLHPDPLPTVTPLSRTETTEPIAGSAERRSSPAAAIPTIQVTIGRIEVRATPPAANRPKPSRSTPQLSLQDYLKQQGLKDPGGTR